MRKAILALSLSCVAVTLLTLVEGVVLQWFERNPFSAGPLHASVFRFSTLTSDGPALALYWARSDEPKAGAQYYLGLYDLPLGQHFRPICLSPLQPLSVTWTGEGRKMVISNVDGSLYTWDADNPQEPPQVLGKHMSARNLACTADGQFLIAASDDLLSVWDLKSRTLRWQRDDCKPNCIAVHPQSGHVICGTAEGDVVELDLATGKSLRTVARHQIRVVAITVSRAGTHMASIGSDRRLLVTDWESGRALWSRPHYDPGAVCFSPAGDTLVSSGFEGNGWQLLVWDAQTGQRRAQFEGHRLVILGVTFGADGNLYSWSADGTVRAWDPLKLAAIGVFSASLPTCPDGTPRNNLHVQDG